VRLSTKLALGALILAALPRRRTPSPVAAGADGAVVLSSADPVPPPMTVPGGPPVHDGDDHLAAPPSGLRAAVMSGLVWKALSILVKQGSRVIVGIILARLLTPEDYGLAALVLVFSSLVFIFSDLSLGAALVQRAKITEKDRSTVFWVSVAVGVVCTLVGIAVAPLVADFYREPDVEPLFMAVSISFVIVSLGVTQEALLTRAMDFRSLEIRQMAAALAGAVVAVVIAARGGGAWAIIVQQVVVVLVATVMMWLVTPWRPRFTFSKASLGDLGAFGGNVFGSRLIFYLNRNADNMLIGRFIGPAPLGAYSLAYNVILLPFSQVAGPLEQLLYPAFARMQEDMERLRVAFLRVIRLIAAVNMPILFGLAVLADVFVPVVLGEQWEDAIPIIQILAAVGVAQSLQALNGSILQACDRTRLLLRYSIVFTVVTVGAFAAGVPFGIVGVAAALGIASIVLEPLYAVMTARTMGMSVWRIPRSLSGVTQATIGMLAAVLAARWGVERAGGGEALQLLAGIAAGVVTYPPLLMWRDPETVADFRGMLARRRAREAAE
jgi:O-antigen/teichoic acid export membrane protein